MFHKRSFFELSCALGIFVGGVAMAASPLEQGRQIAVEACSACHQVDAQQKRPAPVAEGERTEAPSFREIADRCLSANDLRSRIVNPHYPMRQQEFLPLDLNNLSIYIRSLAHRPDCAIR
jgi:hypothetical protein